MEKEHILQILLDLKEAIKKEDLLKIKDLSNKTIHSASIFQDADSIAIAVIIYSLGKIIERKDYRTKPGWEKFYRKVLLNIDFSIDYLKKNDLKKFSLVLKNLRKDIGAVSGKLRKNIQEVFYKASINKASRLYEHGISMEKTAKLLGVTLWELSNYTGQTGIADTKFSKTSDVKSRIKLTMEMFE